MRHKGSLKLSSNIEPNVSAPLDARTVVDTIEDLLDENSFTYPYVGMSVTVKNEGNIYVLLNDEDTTHIESWKLVGETTHNEGSGTSYDDTEIKSEINDIWKAQGELGAKNLLPYPYAIMDSTVTRSGVSFTLDTNNLGAIVVNSAEISTSNYAYRDIFNRANGSFILPAGTYIVSDGIEDTGEQSAWAYSTWRFYDVEIGEFVNEIRTSKNANRQMLFVVTKEQEQLQRENKLILNVRVHVNPSYAVFNNVVIKPMLRYAEDTDNTWQPYVPTNKELAEQIKTISNANNIRTPINIRATKTKTEYQQGEIINLDDLKVQVSFDNGTTEETSHYTTNIDTLDTFTAGLKQLVVSYYDNGVKVSDTVNLKVSFDESCDKVQYAYKIANAGAIRPQTTILGLNSKLYKYSQMQLKLKLHLIIEQNNNANPTNITIANSDFVKNTIFGKVTIPAYEVGEYDIVVDMPFEYNNSTVEPPMDLIYLKSDGGAYVNGMFENRGYSLALISEFQLAPVAIAPSKITKYFVTDEDVEYSDVTAIVTFNDDSTQTFNADELIINTKNIDNTQVGDQKLIVGYAQNGKQINSNVNLHFFAHDKTEPDEFVDMTADEWYNSWKYGINFGNCLDPHGTGYQPLSMEGDRFIDGTKGQEIHWNQPKITQQNVQELVDAGFEMVRIPITWYPNAYYTKEMLGTFDDNGEEEYIKHYHIGKWWLYRVREIVDWCLDAGLKVLINTHHDSEVMFQMGIKNEETLNERYRIAREWWTEIAEKFKYHNQNLAFEGFNEIDNAESGWNPSALAQQQMNGLNQAFVDAVRSTGANNIHRILVCPFLIHRVGKLLSDNYVVPHDIGDENSEVSNYIGTAVHWYPMGHTQVIDTMMSQIENFRNQLSIPIMINEYGLQLTKHDTAERTKYYINYINRAAQHNVKTVIWDNGTDFNVVKKHNASGKGVSPLTYEESEQMCRDIAQGVANHTAYKLPDSQVLVYDNINTILSGDLKDDGTLGAATWTNFITKDLIYVKAGQTVNILCNRVSAHSSKKKLCVGSIVYYDNKQNFVRIQTIGTTKNQVAEATVQIEETGYIKVSFWVASGSPVLKDLASLDEYMFSQGDNCIISIYQDKDEQEITLQDRVPYSIKGIEVLDNGICDSQGNWTKEPKYVLNIAYDNGTTHSLYYSGSRFNIGQARLVIPNIDTSTPSTYECAVEYTYNGVTLTYPNTGIMVQTGVYLNSIEKVTLPTTTTFDISEYTKEQIIDKLKEEIEVIGHYSDDTTKVIDDYVLNVDGVTFSEIGTYHVYISVPTLNYETTFDIQIVDSTFDTDQYHMLAVASKQQLTDWVNNSTASSKVKESWINALNKRFLISLNDGRVISGNSKLVYDTTNDKYYYGNGDQYVKSFYQRDYFTEFVNSELLSTSIGGTNPKSPYVIIDAKNNQTNYVVDSQNRLWVILDKVSYFKDADGNFVGIKNTAYNIRKINSMDELGTVEI